MDTYLLDDDDEMLEAWVTSGPAFDHRSDADAVESAIRTVFPAARGMSSAQVRALASEAVRGMSPEDAEDFLKTLAGIGSAALPVIAPIVGTAIGGPAGTAIGGIVGQLGGSLLGSLAQQPASPLPPPPAPPPQQYAPPAPPYAPPAPPIAPPIAPPLVPPRPPAPPAPSTGNGGSAVAQLFALVQNPVVLQAILSQLFPQLASRGTSDPAFGAIMNAISVLANQAAAEAESGGAYEGATYYGAEGWIDPAVPEQRAEAVRRQLRAGARQARWSTAEASDDVGAWLARAGFATTYA